jgi:hypothetical protein
MSIKNHDILFERQVSLTESDPGFVEIMIDDLAALVSVKELQEALNYCNHSSNTSSSSNTSNRKDDVIAKELWKVKRRSSISKDNIGSVVRPYTYRVPKEPVLSASFVEGVDPEILEIPYDLYIDLIINVREFRDFKALYEISVTLASNQYTDAYKDTLYHKSLVEKEFFKILSTPIEDLIVSLIGECEIEKESGFDYIGEN